MDRDERPVRPVPSGLSAAPAAPITSSGPLTRRESEVLGLVARGLANAEVAARLHRGETTVKTHLGRILDELAVPDRPRLIAWAWEHGVVTS
ncbi:LuxR C-terminal-related transcriptional regulator [Actinomycetospora sp. NBRC 106378]|uniref:response regulator transcription factor n=1 Tax=Actinomycetospora sp. NBRC 106378 TaxID=3032208 RepID=UPI0024A139CE|nr:LuxR C-terminal-related transcriptional regulator [Actinomycetospora sp. NBRC 106378]GLZ53754.1 hypothetical protein Acsp07_33710 [Actinomycetospora sp. NBRC 106378]